MPVELPTVPLLVEHRFIVGLLDAIVPGGVLLGSVYLEDGVGVEGNADLLMLIASYVRAVGESFVLAGDWNVSPTALADSSWVAAVGGVIQAPRSETYVSGTCKGRQGFLCDGQSPL